MIEPEFYNVEHIVFKQRMEFKKKRIQCGLSRQNVADLLDVSISTINRWESDKHFMPTIEGVKKICFFVDNTIGDIYNFLTSVNI